jgi:hypothetical protein
MRRFGGTLLDPVGDGHRDACCRARHHRTGGQLQWAGGMDSAL